MARLLQCAVIRVNYLLRLNALHEGIMRTTSRPFTPQRRRVGVGFVLVTLSHGACIGAVNEDEDTPSSYEEFRARVYREPATGVYIVDGDTPIEMEDGLRQFYTRYLQELDGPEPSDKDYDALIVNQAGGVDDRWSDAQKLNLTYCVSTSFGNRHDAVVQAMASATTAWEQAANINFIYRSEQDCRCDASNTEVVFNVSPTTGQPYLARAFRPSFARANRNLLIDSQSFGAIAPRTLAGVLRHELGHTLGFRHEHTRPEAGVCFENQSWRALTAYDSASVMHYPQCNGTNNGDPVLTRRDRDGARALYGASSWSWRVVQPTTSVWVLTLSPELL